MVEKILRLLIPRRLISAFRLIQIFHKKHGHIRRLGEFPINGMGKYQPWLTYPLIEFLSGLDFSEKTVFEFGAGSSTLYWAKRAKYVTSVEMDRKWYEQLLPIVPENVKLIHEPDGEKYPNIIFDSDNTYDVIVVDGAARYQSVCAALKKLSTKGMIILDNAEWYPNAADLLASLEFIEVRFSGFTPINAFTSTSTVFMSRSFSFPINYEARQPPIGGRGLPHPAFDDHPVECKTLV